MNHIKMRVYTVSHQPNIVSISVRFPTWFLSILVQQRVSYNSREQLGAVLRFFNLLYISKETFSCLRRHWGWNCRGHCVRCRSYRYWHPKGNFSPRSVQLFHCDSIQLCDANNRWVSFLNKLVHTYTDSVRFVCPSWGYSRNIYQAFCSRLIEMHRGQLAHVYLLSIRKWLCWQQF